MDGKNEHVDTSMHHDLAKLADMHGLLRAVRIRRLIVEDNSTHRQRRNFVTARASVRRKVLPTPTRRSLPHSSRAVVSS
eukprot:5906172-Pleurochrysis_carterae.AAC.1